MMELKEKNTGCERIISWVPTWGHIFTCLIAQLNFFGDVWPGLYYSSFIMEYFPHMIRVKCCFNQLVC